MYLESIASREGLSFHDDQFNRGPFGESLTNVVNAMSDGGVLAIDGGWGEGKTTFIRCWKHEKEQQEGMGKTIYFDAFTRDHAEDPFLPLVGPILDISRNCNDEALSDCNSALKDNAIKIAKSFGVSVLKNGAAVFSNGFVTPESIEIVQRSVSSESAWGLDAAIVAELDQYSEYESSIAEFKRSLTKWAESNNGLVFIVDELDRCKPTFAVSLLERLKHLFDVPGIVFVLVMNRKHLEDSIKGIYGPSIKAEPYLSKFIHFFLKLPKALSTEGVDRANAFVRKSLERLNFSENEEWLIDTTVGLALSFDLSVREVEALCSYIALVCFIPERGRGLRLVLIPLLCAMRLRHDNWFESLLSDEVDQSMLRDLGERLKPFRTDQAELVYSYLVACYFTSQEEEQLGLIAPDKRSHAFTFRGRIAAGALSEPGKIVADLCQKIAQVG